MLINPLNSDPSFIKSVQYSSGTGNIGKVSDPTFRQDQKVFQKYTTTNEKNTIVSEKLDQEKTVQSYNLRLQQFTPASQILETITPYNDVQKYNTSKSKTESNYNQSKRKKTLYEKYSEDSPIENGYYIVINDNGTNQSLKQLKDNISSWRDKINKKYNAGYFKEPGTLVNSLA